MDFFAGDAFVVSCESRGDPESGNLAFANTHTPEYPFFAVDTANLIVGYSGRSLVNFSVNSATCCSCSLCSCKENTSGCSSSTIFRSKPGFLSISDRKPATFHDTALNVFVPGGGNCLGAGSLGMMAGRSVFCVFGFLGSLFSDPWPASLAGGVLFLAGMTPQN